MSLRERTRPGLRADEINYWTLCPDCRILVRIAAWALAITIVVLSVVPADDRPESGLPHGLEHFAIYWATGIAFACGYNLTPTLLAIALVIFSGGVEIAQLFVPGRHARVSDCIIDRFVMHYWRAHGIDHCAGSRVPSNTLAASRGAGPAGVIRKHT
jgi:hypothetical protein